MTETEDTRGEDRAAWKLSFRAAITNAPFETLPIEAYDTAPDEVRDLTDEEVDDRLMILSGGRVIGLVPVGYIMQPRRFSSNSLMKGWK